MEFPFFALQKRPLLTPILYQDGNVSIRISPGERGIASIWDKDVLIYLSSLINAKIERGEEVSRTVRFAAYDLLRVTRRHTGKNGYQEIYDALFRLRSTTITTDIQSGGERETRGFGWIDSFRILTRENKAGSRVMQGLTEHMLHPSPHLRARLVALLLPLRQLPPPVRLAVDPAAQVLFLQLFFCLR
jgi:plasmid replication initiation protein